ncbi:Shr3 amino acid permease chaperone [Cyathus striatus]|nr:Shr3 amino acid permease chaperone [Cyathus striatus]
MGFRQAAVLAPVCFFLGVLFICFNVDHKILWTELTDDVVADGFQFYTTFFNAPPAIKALLHGMMGVGLIGLVSKLHNWDESAIFFDGSSLVTFVFAIAVYLTVIIPTLPETRNDQIEALRVLSAGNIIIIMCFGLVLVLQAGQEYSRRQEAKALSRLEEERKKKADTALSDKKDQ